MEIPEKDHPRRLPLLQPELWVGRSEECDIVLPFPQISRRHARLVREGEHYRIEDLKSANGLKVNQKSVERQLLQDGDELALGSFRLFYRNPSSPNHSPDSEQEYDFQNTISFPVSSGLFAQEALLRLAEKDAAATVQIIFKAAKSLLASKNLSHILSRVMDLVFDHLQAERGLLMLCSRTSREPVPYIVKHRESPLSPASDNARYSRTIVNQVIREGVATLSSNAMKDERFDFGASVVSQQIRSCMCVPLWDEEKVIGAIYLDSRSQENAFQEKDLELLSTIGVISAVAISQSQLREEMEKERNIREQLQRYHSPAVVNSILDSGLESFGLGEEKEISILVADLTGFTPLSEKQKPTEVANILNTFFTAMTEIIFQYEGTLDKYIGDAVMAVFGAPIDQEDHAARAVRAALEMCHTLREMNRIGIFPEPLHMRIGINSGKAIVGDIGSERRLEYTVLGSPVNVAFRLESGMARPGDILIGERTRNHIGDCFATEDLGLANLKGIRAPLRVFRVLQKHS